MTYPVHNTRNITEKGAIFAFLSKKKRSQLEKYHFQI